METEDLVSDTVSLAEQCIVLLGAFSEHQPRWSADQLARFKIWSTSLGVFEPGHASIDYRLRDHPDVLNLVNQQLEVLMANLDKLNRLGSEPAPFQLQKRVTSGSEAFEVDGEEFVYESPTSEASFSSSDLEFKSKGHQDKTMSDGLQVVEETTARLNALASAIRKSGKQSRASKADLYEVIEDVDGARVNMTQEFQKYAFAIVAREIPGAEHFLKERLTVSVARRRNRFLYWKRHDRTSKIYVKRIMPTGQVKELRMTQQGAMSQSGGQDNTKLRSMENEGTIRTGLTATTFDAKNFRRPTESASGSIKPTGSVRWKNREEFPKPPKIGLRESHFVCPICLIPCPAMEGKGDLWVQHVTRDLKPYICVFESCKTPLTTFDNFQDWILHMKNEQMPLEWFCASANHPPTSFDTQDIFESHMREKHSRGFIGAQMHALAQRHVRRAVKVFTCCPFCPYDEHPDPLTHYSTQRAQDDLQHHISSHLLSLAFISLPPLDHGDLSDAESSTSSRVALDSRTDQFEPSELLAFNDVSWDQKNVDSLVAPTDDWDWGFVRDSLGDNRIDDLGFPDSLLGRLNKMQKEQALRSHLNSDAVIDHRPQDTAQGSKHGHSRRPGPGPKDRTYSKNIDGELPSSVVPITLPVDDAERIQRQTVDDRSLLLGPDHPETLASINNLAQAIYFKGRYAEAEVLYKQALAGREKVLGPNHLDTIVSLNNLAQATVYLGRFHEGEVLYARALALGKAVLGEEHPYVLQNTHNLGGALRNQGRHKEAEQLYRTALAGRTKVLGPEHPDTLQSINNLGGTFEKMGKYEKAEELYRQALATREKVLGRDHADTLQSVHNIGGALRNQERFLEAEDLYRQALSGRQTVLGKEHPNTLKSLNNLALVLESMGNLDEAKQTYTEAFEIRRRNLGQDHPDTLQSINNIGSIYLQQSQFDKAEELYHEALDGRLKVLGSEHPDTLQSMRNVGKALEKLGRFLEAELMYRAALLGRVKILGDDHPHTRQVKQDLEGLAAVMSTKEGEKGAGYLMGGRQESDDPDIHADNSVGVEVPRISGPSF